MPWSSHNDQCMAICKCMHMSIDCNARTVCMHVQHSNKAASLVLQKSVNLNVQLNNLFIDQARHYTGFS